MDDFERTVNGMYAIQNAQKVKDYCGMFKRCSEGCVFWCGTCGLNNFPWNWDFKKVVWGDDDNAGKK